MGSASPAHLPKSRGFDSSLGYLNGLNDYLEARSFGDLCPNPADPNWNMHGQCSGLLTSLAFCLLASPMAFPMSDSWRICLPFSKA